MPPRSTPSSTPFTYPQIVAILRRTLKGLTIFAVVTTLTACGQKGPLRLPSANHVDRATYLIHSNPVASPTEHKAPR
jgi:predicted small lipoprotein YifL